MPIWSNDLKLLSKNGNNLEYSDEWMTCTFKIQLWISKTLIFISRVCLHQNIQEDHNVEYDKYYEQCK